MKRPLNPRLYEVDHEDSLIRGVVGSWAKEKHERLIKFVDISKNVRKKFITGRASEATFIDLYSGSGKARIRDTQEIIDGSCVGGARKAIEGGNPFTRVFIADLDREILDAAETRLKAIGVPVTAICGTADQAVEEVAANLGPHGLHFAFLDPYNLDDIPFSVIEKLATFKRMDLLIHISIQDLQRNLSKYQAQQSGPLDRFAPGWRSKVEGIGDATLVRAKILEHWKSLLSKLNLQTTEAIELISGSGNQRLYWLALAAHGERALEFWNKIREIGPKQPDFFLN